MSSQYSVLSPRYPHFGGFAMPGIDPILLG